MPLPLRETAVHPHAELITRFYSAFQQSNAEQMAACYHEQIHFSDPVFPDLHGGDVHTMWDMLCTRGTDLSLEFSNVYADDAAGRAQWIARYTFSATGRSVINRINARFQFRDGLIVRHIDTFSLYAWTRQALGTIGWIAGWSPPLQNRVRRQAAASLANWKSPC